MPIVFSHTYQSLSAFACVCVGVCVVVVALSHVHRIYFDLLQEIRVDELLKYRPVRMIFMLRTFCTLLSNMQLLSLYCSFAGQVLRTLVSPKFADLNYEVPFVSLPPPPEKNALRLTYLRIPVSPNQVFKLEVPIGGLIHSPSHLTHWHFCSGGNSFSLPMHCPAPPHASLFTCSFIHVVNLLMLCSYLQ